MDMFGAGVLFATQTFDASGNAISNPTPTIFGTCQEMSLDFSGEAKMLYGQNQFPVDVARGKTKVGGKIKFAQILAAQFDTIFFGQGISAGLLAVFGDTVGQLIPATPFQITIVPPSSGAFSADQGVFGPDGRPYTRVASGPTTGQYSLAGAVYTFATADTGKKVYINFSYTATPTPGASKGTINNLTMGASPYFGIAFSALHAGKLVTFNLTRCMGSKLALVFKNDDFTVPELDFDAMMDPATGNVGTWSTSD